MGEREACFSGAKFSPPSSSPPDRTVHRIALIAADSSGSPTVSPSMQMSELQPARTSPAASSTLVMGARAVSVAAEGSATPRATSSSVVSVPVLSNKHESTMPAMGTRNGSVQKTCIFISVMRELFTASAVCMGSSGGITDVTMRMQWRRSSYLEGGGKGKG